MKRALVISDGKPGHVNQSVALCKHLGLEVEIAEVCYPRRFCKALSCLFDRFGFYTDRIFRLSTSNIPHSTFHILISAGSTTYYPNKVIAKRLGVPNIAILLPRGYRLDFTHILCPAYDRPPKRSNITELPLNLCAADETFFAEKAAEFKAKHAPEKTATGFIIGGDNAVSKMDAALLEEQLKLAFELTEGCGHWVTTSRRTPLVVEELIDRLPFDYKLINSRDPYNPVPAFIQLCDRLFVTGDSASMISECASFGSAAVEVLMAPQTRSPNKFEKLIAGLEQQEAVHVFDGTLGSANRKMNLSALLNEKLKPLCFQNPKR